MPFSRGSWLSDVGSAAVSAVLLIVCVAVLAASSRPGQIAGQLVAEGSSVALVAMGLTLVLRAGRLDLSVAGTAPLGGVLAARMDLGGHGLLAGLLVAVAVGACVGFVNGLLGCLSRMAAVAATIGTGALAGVLAYLTTTQDLAVPSGAGAGQSATIAVVLAILVAAGVTLLLTLPVARGRLDMLAGEDERSGQVSVALVLAFVCSGALAALAGALDAAWGGIAEPAPATFLLLEAVAAALIGGSALRGRSGAGYGALLASFGITALVVALSLHGVGAVALQGAVGGLVLVGVLFSEARSKLLV